MDTGSLNIPETSLLLCSFPFLHFGAECEARENKFQWSHLANQNAGNLPVLFFRCQKNFFIDLREKTI